jgi:hypothetical protein
MQSLLFTLHVNSVYIFWGPLCHLNLDYETTIFVVQWSEFLTTDPEVLGSIPGSTMEIFP